MAIDGGLRDKLQPGTRLWARYRGSDYVAEVAVGEDGKRRYRLADGREFKSLSAAGSAVMAGIACNGWRFWNLAGDGSQPMAEMAAEPGPRTPAARPGSRTKNQVTR